MLARQQVMSKPIRIELQKSSDLRKWNMTAIRFTKSF